MKENLENILKRAKDMIDGTTLQSDLEEMRVRFLGRKGELTSVLKQMKNLSAEERPVIGKRANEVRVALEEVITTKRAEFAQADRTVKLKTETIDVTLPGKEMPLGHKHPLSIVEDEVKEIFLGMGFNIATGPEVELDYYNFEALNIPPNHPARDTQDTFYVNPEVVLRSQTSPVQIRVMETQKPPIRIIAPGRVYRSDETDATHSPIFHQIEGLVVDKGIAMSDLKGNLDALAKRLYGSDTVTRFRPHHFRFTEPSCEVDIRCFQCAGKGCSMCKQEGWIEILGGGMVHPDVLRRGNIDPAIYSGFAFGVGLDRLTMFRFDIDDLRLLYDNNLRFLTQF